MRLFKYQNATRVDKNKILIYVLANLIIHLYIFEMRSQQQMKRLINYLSGDKNFQFYNHTKHNSRILFALN